MIDFHFRNFQTKCSEKKKHYLEEKKGGRAPAAPPLVSASVFERLALGKRIR